MSKTGTTREEDVWPKKYGHNQRCHKLTCGVNHVERIFSERPAITFFMRLSQIHLYGKVIFILNLLS